MKNKVVQCATAASLFLGWFSFSEPFGLIWRCIWLGGTWRRHVSAMCVSVSVGPIIIKYHFSFLQSTSDQKNLKKTISWTNWPCHTSLPDCISFAILIICQSSSDANGLHFYFFTNFTFIYSDHRLIGSLMIQIPDVFCVLIRYYGTSNMCNNPSVVIIKM